MANESGLLLSGRAIVVTGASSGIGRAIALAAGRAGADVALTYRANASGAREVEQALTGMGRRTAIIQMNLADEGSIRAAVSAAWAALGTVDVWVNNAGADILTGDTAHLPDVEKLDLLLSVDLRGTVLASWRAAERMQAGGAIINMSWDHVLLGMEGRNPQMYSAVKGGVLSFSRSLARSLAPRVRVNVLAPGWIDTAFGNTMDRAAYQKIADSTPLKRWGTPEDVAGAAVFLASPAASFMTGQMLMVGGGVAM